MKDPKNPPKIRSTRPLPEQQKSGKEAKSDQDLDAPEQSKSPHKGSRSKSTRKQRCNSGASSESLRWFRDWMKLIRGVVPGLLYVVLLFVLLIVFMILAGMVLFNPTYLEKTMQGGKELLDKALASSWFLRCLAIALGGGSAASVVRMTRKK